MRLRTFLHAYAAEILLEASKYDALFGAILAIEPTAKSNIDPIITWARQSLQREDRIIWFLRWYRIIYLNVLLTSGSDALDPDDPNYLGLWKLEKRYIAEMEKLTGKPAVDVHSPALRNIRGALDHYLSLPVPDIQTLQFTNQTPDDLFAQMSAFEHRWQVENEKDEQLLQPQEGDSILIPFTDGWAWWLLPRGGCELEGKAMGHCGNMPSQRPGDRLISLRKEGPRDWWRPSATFVLHQDGMLGEMKGRGNDKPTEQYHPYIVSLLQHDIIRGIVGGGYMPAHNFSMSDLPQEQQDELMEKKPALATAMYIFKKFGPTDDFGLKAAAEFDSKIGMGRQDVKWDSELKSFVVGEYDNVDAMINEHGTDFMQRLAGAFSGGDDMFMDNDYGADNDQAKELLDELPPEVQQKVLDYALRTYASDEQHEDKDWTSLDDVWDILVEENDDIVYNLTNAVETGLRYGTEHEAYNDFMNALKDPFMHTDSSYLDTIFTTYQNQDGTTVINMDGPCKIVVSAQEGARILDDENELHDIEYNGFVHEEINVEEPHYGWSGYDKDAAKEQAIDNLSNL